MTPAPGPETVPGAVARFASVTETWEAVTRAVASGRRFAGLMATRRPADLVLSAHVAGPEEISTYETAIPGDAGSYPCLTASLPAAFWYERKIHDLFGVTPLGHPRLEPLVLPVLRQDAERPLPGLASAGTGQIWPDEHSLPRHVMGPGMFTIPHGPVRSGVLESIEYLVETPGEDIPHLNIRVFYKHRGIEKRFESQPAADGAPLAERVEGIASVAHALAYCHAVERLGGEPVPRPAALIRVAYAELERIANHLDVATRLADAAGLAVATARFGTHREHVLRLVSRMCGSRFGRGVVVPGGVAALPQIGPDELLSAVTRLESAVLGDARELMATASFVDRLRGTGRLSAQRAAEHGALGPIGRASGAGDDARRSRPYDGYRELSLAPAHGHEGGDALARLAIRWEEISQSCDLLRQVAQALPGVADQPLRATAPEADGRAVGWAEAPQGEVLYDIRIESGIITRCAPRSASFHNLVLFHDVFAGDILTDFPFIEASFGLSVAGVAL